MSSFFTFLGRSSINLTFSSSNLIETLYGPLAVIKIFRRNRDFFTSVMNEETFTSFQPPLPEPLHNSIHPEDVREKLTRGDGVF